MCSHGHVILHLPAKFRSISETLWAEYMAWPQLDPFLKTKLIFAATQESITFL